MKEAIRVQQPDGSFKIVFREHKEAKTDSKKELNTNNKQRKDPRYYNPINPNHIDIFGMDLIGKKLIFSLLNNDTVIGTLKGYGQYDCLIETDIGNVIIMKSAILTISFGGDKK